MPGINEDPINTRRLADGRLIATYRDGSQYQFDPVLGTFTELEATGPQADYSDPQYTPPAGLVVENRNAVPTTDRPATPTGGQIGTQRTLFVEPGEQQFDVFGRPTTRRYDVIDPASGTVLYSTDSASDATKFAADVGAQAQFLTLSGSPRTVTDQGQDLQPNLFEQPSAPAKIITQPDELEINAINETYPQTGTQRVLAQAQQAVNPGVDSTLNQGGNPYDIYGNLNPGWFIDFDGIEYYAPDTVNNTVGGNAGSIQGFNLQALTSNSAKKIARKTAPDWRFRLQLANGANYLYKDGNPYNILYPLYLTNGVIFPYTPKITVDYTANYDPYDLVHTNYRGYFYKQSQVSELSLNATFTAQSSSEADYLLAVIHFFRSVTKMFYGNDGSPVAGTPPPVCFLTGLGPYQFNRHPVLVSNFNYNLPSDVDYIRAGSLDYQGGLTPLNQIRNQFGGSGGGIIDAVTNRIINAGIEWVTTAINSGLGSSSNNPLSSGAAPSASPITGDPSYVPTKIEISLRLLPVISRARQATGFSLSEYQNGSLLRRGVW